MKKMRKLIPALAMLLVSAVMMSTASFAWFSMNDVATATGMSVQAKASGNLLISKDTLNASTTTISVDMGSTKVNLFPITYKTGLGESVGPWVVPTAGKDVDPIKGTYTGAWSTVTADTVGNYFAQYTVYIATAGDALTNQTLSVDLTGISGIDQEIAPAYTAAFYVTEKTASGYATPDWNTPDAVHSYKSYLPAETGTAGKKVIKTNVNIPSTYGTNAENEVGTRIIIRIYIDGALEDANKLQVQTPTLVTPATDTKYAPTAMAGYTFYKADNTTVAVDTSMWTSETSLNGYVYWDGTAMTTTNETVPYVRNTTVPTGATIFEMDFSCATPTP